ncbi:MAG: hypothetical protein K2F81_01405 [Ruminococcus sp.]|nr:hypothetical protein [Ruminococcus sp.]
MSEIKTSVGEPITSNLLRNYFRNLVNQFFKILPMRENEEDSLCVYMKSLQSELLGCKELIPEVRECSLYLTLLAILQYLIDNPECKVSDVKREVFRAISVCNKLKSIYTNMEVSE